MPTITTPQILSLINSIQQLDEILKDELTPNNALIAELDIISANVLQLRSLMGSEVYCPSDFAAQLSQFYNEHFLPFLCKHLNQKNPHLNNGGIEYHCYKALSCITGLVADVTDHDKNEEQPQCNIDTALNAQACKTIQDYGQLPELLHWSKEYFTIMQEDIEHIAGISKKSNKQFAKFAGIRKAINTLLLEPNIENANVLLALLIEKINSKLLSDFVKRKKNWAYYFRIVSLMHHCMENLPSGPVYDAMNNIYASMLLNIMKRGFKHQGVLHSELRFALNNESGLDAKTKAEGNAYLKWYGERKSRFADKQSQLDQTSETAAHIHADDLGVKKIRSQISSNPSTLFVCGEKPAEITIVTQTYTKC